MGTTKKGAKPKKLGVKKQTIRKQGQLSEADADAVAGGGAAVGCLKSKPDA